MSPGARRPSRGGVLALCFALGLIEGYDIQIIGVAAPAVSQAFRISTGALATVFLASNLGLLVNALVGGQVSDHRGRRPALVGSALFFALFTLLSAAAPSLPAFVVLRLLAGAGLGGALPNQVATASDIAPPGRRGVVTGLMFCGVPLGGAGVALLSRVGDGALGWRGLFVIGGVAPLLVAGLLLAWLPETRPDRPAGPSGLRPLLAQGVRRRTLWLWARVGPTSMALYLILYWLPTLVLARGFSPDVAAEASAAFNLCGAAGAVGMGRLADRRASAEVLALAFFAFVGVVLALSQTASALGTLILSGAAGFLLLGLTYAAYGLSARIYPATLKGTGAGAAVGAGRLGSLIGPLLPALALAAGAAPSAVLWLLAPAASLAGLALLLMRTGGGSD